MDQADPREIQTLQMYLNEYGQQIELMTQQLSMIEQQRLEGTAAIETLRALQENADGAVLLPIGGGAYLRVKVLDAGHVLVNIGADVSVERATADAVGYLEDRITELEALAKKVAGSVEQLQGQATEISRRLEAAYRGARQAQAGQGGSS
ncbi:MULTISPECIES: prefoldin subunit alpha [Methanoculleus]|uniref:Prefoldin subunit alpha n=2 Tax=Methanoculleus TaxID=45989 RepID=PFDA_METMJ|nr:MULTISPECIES: prefoldin subunit alpha [Methanoculleus]A3CWZ2.1 RecName: Full=Prefoldin subunit alpha; AltName: Full=GimC subunit alpha [Methanoculleus marisnigri JR1]ABN57892.1 prefoldin, alpha subunit [Methanoculleus marisnigri JR1]MCC7556993.1 prefoldin subunit alpha [Methanoculleus marisnigri]UYU19277.1 prefoldin subunit alpha [Methanoculleus submarinus]